jgi:hypothetical protein
MQAKAQRNTPVKGSLRLLPTFLESGKENHAGNLAHPPDALWNLVAWDDVA